jgi:hypothetical protein
MKKHNTAVVVVALFALLSTPINTQAVSNSEQVVDCKSSWMCFKNASKTCALAKVKKTLPTIEFFGLKTKAFTVLELKGEDASGQCVYTQTPYKYRYTPTPSYTETIMRQDGVDEAAVRKMVRDFEKMANTPEVYAMSTFICSGETKDVATFFRSYTREYKKMNSSFSGSTTVTLGEGSSTADTTKNQAAMEFLNKKVRCSTK